MPYHDYRVEVISDNIIVNDDPISYETIKKLINNLHTLKCPISASYCYGYDCELCYLGEYHRGGFDYYYIVATNSSNIYVRARKDKNEMPVDERTYEVTDQKEMLLLMRHLLRKNDRRLPIFNHTFHKKLWDAVSKDPNLDREDIVKTLFRGCQGDFVISMCSACTYAHNFDAYICNNCPLEFDYDSIKDDKLKALVKVYMDLGYNGSNRCASCGTAIKIINDFQPFLKLTYDAEDREDMNMVEEKLGYKLTEDKMKDLYRKCAEFLRDAPVKEGVYCR